MEQLWVAHSNMKAFTHVLAFIVSRRLINDGYVLKKSE